VRGATSSRKAFPPRDAVRRCWQFAIMVKTQIQLPENLYRDAKRVAAEYEMSFAEVVRRSLERALPAYAPRHADWQPPVPVSLGLRCAIDDDELRLLANEPDYQPRHLKKTRRSRR